MGTTKDREKRRKGALHRAIVLPLGLESFILIKKHRSRILISTYDLPVCSFFCSRRSIRYSNIFK